MINNEESLSKKRKSLKLAIERYNEYKNFADDYKLTNSLDKYIAHIRHTSTNLSSDLLVHYENMIATYNTGNYEPLLSNLYDRLLAADDYKHKVTYELKSLLRAL
jgi:predicted DNA-binding ribbon-helix-helix protein